MIELIIMALAIFGAVVLGGWLSDHFREKSEELPDIDDVEDIANEVDAVQQEAAKVDTKNQKV
jgi:hypothetical protein